MTGARWRITALLAAALLLAGCAGLEVRPAVETPPEPEREQAPADTAASQPQPDREPAPVAEVMVMDTTRAPGDVEPAETEPPVTVQVQEKPAPPDTFDLPDEALPRKARGLKPVDFLPTDGPAPRGGEPPETTDGWRVQVATLTAEQSASTTLAQARRAVPDSVPVQQRYREGRYVIYAGAYAGQGDAEELRDRLIRQGFEGAFVIKARMADRPDSPAATDSAAAPSARPKRPERATPGEAALREGWRVQVMSLSDRTTALAEKNNIAVRTVHPVYIEEVEGSWKIRIGNFSSREAATAARDELVRAGFEGAFPVQTRILVRAAASEE